MSYEKYVRGQQGTCNGCKYLKTKDFGGFECERDGFPKTKYSRRCGYYINSVEAYVYETSIPCLFYVLIGGIIVLICMILATCSPV